MSSSLPAKSISDFVQEHFLENAWVQFSDGHEEPFETAMAGIVAGERFPASLDAVLVLLPPGCSIILRSVDGEA